MRLLPHLAFVSIVNTGCHALEENLNIQVPLPIIADFSIDPSDLFEEAERAQRMIYDRSSSSMTNANIIQNEMKHSSIIDGSNPLKRNRKDFENSSISSSSYQHAASEPSLQANLHDVSHHQVNGFPYSNNGQVASTVSSYPHDASINAISPKYPFATSWNPSKNTHHESLSSDPEAAALREGPFHVDQVSPRDISNMTLDNHRNLHKNVNSRDKEVPLSFFESSSHQGSQDPLEKIAGRLLSDAPISNSNAQVDSIILPEEKKSSSSHPSSVLLDDLWNVLQRPHFANEKNFETARGVKAPIRNSLKSQKSRNKLSPQNIGLPHVRNVPKKSIKSKATRVPKAKGFKTYTPASQLGMKTQNTAFPLVFKTQNIDFQHIFEFCQNKPDALIGYFDAKYNIVVSAHSKNFSDRKAAAIFFAYLLFVEMINEISPRHNVADVGIESACQSFITQSQYLEITKDTTPWEDRSSVEKFDLLWCYLQRWMIVHGSSLIDRFKTAENPGFLPDDLKSFLNHIFVLKFRNLGNKSDQSSPRQSHLKKHSSDHNSQGPSDKNDVRLPIQSQPLTSLSSSTTGLERKSSNLPEPSPIKFFEKDLHRNSHGAHWDPLLSTLRKKNKFPLVLDDGHAVESLVRSIVGEKRLSTNENDSNTLSQIQIKNEANRYRYSLFNQARDVYEQNLETWFRYFDQRYNLHTELYYQDLDHGPSKKIFPLYLFFVEMINQIVPGDSANGGMLWACYYFEKLLKFHANPESPEENQRLRKFINMKVKNYSPKKGRTLMWGFVEYWLMKDRPELSEKLLLRKSSIELQRNIKGLFDEIFFLSCVQLTQKLKGERIFLDPETAPDLVQLHNDSQPCIQIDDLGMDY